MTGRSMVLIVGTLPHHYTMSLARIPRHEDDDAVQLSQIPIQCGYCQATHSPVQLTLSRLSFLPSFVSFLSRINNLFSGERCMDVHFYRLLMDGSHVLDPCFYVSCLYIATWRLQAAVNVIIYCCGSCCC
jgi:hypothetical protein